MAAELGVNLAAIPGSGDGGRIVRRDVEAALAGGATAAQAQPAATTVHTPTPQVQAVAAPAPVGGYTDHPVSQMRAVIARRLSESKFTAPHFYLTVSVDMDAAIAFRNQVNDDLAKHAPKDTKPEKISFNDLVIKAVATALRKHLAVNSSWLGNVIRTYDYVNVGVAVAVDEGLLVPVLRNADQLGLSEIGARVRDYATRARDKKLKPDEMTGNTFTISNLGMFGIEEFTAIINPPDACILAVGGISEVPVVKNGEIVPGNVMKLTLSCDHRVVDGAVGSAFLGTLKRLLENPVRMLV
jgi:pyruvate dehydrogenase E2 component (dihydrolipoamide acetyltransferase)